MITRIDFQIIVKSPFGCKEKLDKTVHSLILYCRQSFPLIFSTPNLHIQTGPTNVAHLIIDLDHQIMGVINTHGMGLNVHCGPRNYSSLCFDIGFGS